MNEKQQLDAAKHKKIESFATWPSRIGPLDFRQFYASIQ